MIPRLTGLAAEIAEVVGLEAAFRLMMKRGGMLVKIPLRVPGSLLEELIGTEAAEAMSDHFGAGLELHLPCANLRGAGGRRAMGVAMLLRGENQFAVAVTCDVSIRTVRYWQSALVEQGAIGRDGGDGADDDPGPRQLPLF